MRLGECPYTVQFPGSPDVVRPGMPSWADRGTLYQFREANGTVYHASCNCSESQNFGDITEIQALHQLEGTEHNKNYRDVNIRFRENSQLGKLVAYSADIVSGPLASHLLQGKSYFTGNCIAEVIGIGPTSYGRRELLHFVDSVKRIP
jgi:hypothetical protein